VARGGLESQKAARNRSTQKERNIMLRVLVMAGVFAIPLSAAAFTGNELNSLCTKTDPVSRGACTAYVEGAADGVYNTIEAIGGTSGPQVGQYFCLPVDPKPQQLTDAVRKYIAENPDKANFNATTMVSLGLGKAFPCKGGD
jgi:Rap1a immunity proteins